MPNQYLLIVLARVSSQMPSVMTEETTEVSRDYACQRVDVSEIAQGIAHEHTSICGMLARSEEGTNIELHARHTHSEYRVDLSMHRQATGTLETVIQGYRDEV
eukprot:GHVR01176861.1.p2 GENE.GHVR01176861.1~~GHVR01176861.1.p2  ORF type:complete len:103 (+),score=2.51 GHVR01176861.1:415-723(+)